MNFSKPRNSTMCRRTWWTLLFFVEQHGHLAVALDAGHRIDGDAAQLLRVGGGFEDAHVGAFSRNETVG